MCLVAVVGLTCVRRKLGQECEAMHHYNMAVFLDPNKADQASRPVRARLTQGALTDSSAVLFVGARRAGEGSAGENEQGTGDV